MYRTLLFQQLSDLVGTRIEAPDSGEQTPPPYTESEVPGPGRPASALQVSPMRTAVTLVLQYPAVVCEDDIEYYDFDESQPGGYILQKLVATTLANPEMHSAGLLEHFRDAREWDYLCQLATRDVPGVDGSAPDAARQLFRDCIGQLGRANRRRDNASLRQMAARGESEEELKERLRATYQE